MSLPALTAVICFANEGEEVEITVQGLRDTCGDDIDILLINDASDDGRDYETVADRYGCRYLLNENQIGPAHSRHKGASWAKTENVIFLDAHMRFYERGWHIIVNEMIAQNPTTLFCTKSKPLKPGGEPSGAPTGHGASMIFMADDFNAALKPDWNIYPLEGAGPAYVPCVLGGNYAVNRDFFLSIGGYRGLHRYGGEEALISIKTWLAGGNCQLIRDVEIGHIYRDGRGAPWKDKVKYFHFNKLATAEILFDAQERAPYFKLLDALPEGKSAKQVFDSRRSFVHGARKVFQSVKRHPMAYFHELNDAFRRKESITPKA